MKKLAIAISVLLLSTTALFAQNKNDKFEVNGNCGMCEKRIEAAALSVKGVESAEWNKDTKFLKVSYDESTTNTDKIQMAVAKVGHDTHMYKAETKVYNKLPGCCKYDRDSEMEEDHSGHKH